MRSRLAVPALLVLAAVVPEATATEASFIIVNPAGRGNQSMAQGFLADFSRVVRASWPADAGAPPELTGQYHVHQADALASIRKKRPIFGVLSPGFFLELRDDLELEPLMLPRQPGDAAPVVHAVVVEGSPGLAGYDALRIRVKGDGRTWVLGARGASRRGDSHWERFETDENEWQTVTVPIRSMVRQFFGRPIEGRLEPDAVRGLEFYIYDKQAGPFRLQVDHIEAVRNRP